MTTATWAGVEVIIRTRIRTQLTEGGDGGANVPTHVPNAGWFSGATAIAQPKSGARIEFDIVPRRTRTLEVSSPSTDHRGGDLVVTAKVDVGSGDAALAALSDRIEAAFLKDLGDGIYWRSPTPGPKRVVGGAREQDVICPFDIYVVR